MIGNGERWWQCMMIMVAMDDDEFNGCWWWQKMIIMMAMDEDDDGNW